MTTIATDGKTMAGDSQISNGLIHGYAQKVWRTPDGRLFGSCGDTTQTLKFKRWMLGGGKLPELNDTLAALILNTDGTVDWVDDEGEVVRVMVPFAVGSGAEFAMGAMEAGASPEDAVAIAAKRDTGTGGKITVLSL